MRERPFDRFTRQTAQTVSRRGSLLPLGGAVVAASLGTPTMAAAKSKGRKSKGKHKRQPNAVCTRQVAQCRDALPGLCASAIEKADECVTLLLPCCDFFAKCDVGAAFACASNVITAARSG